MREINDLQRLRREKAVATVAYEPPFPTSGGLVVPASDSVPAFLSFGVSSFRYFMMSKNILRQLSS
jgi:hypothetical protein